jgi:hypothetical protein
MAENPNSNTLGSTIEDRIKVLGKPVFMDPMTDAKDDIIYDSSIIETQVHQIFPLGGIGAVLSNFNNHMGGSQLELEFNSSGVKYDPNSARIHATVKVELDAVRDAVHDVDLDITSNVEKIFAEYSLFLGASDIIERLEHVGNASEILKLPRVNYTYYRCQGSVEGFIPDYSVDSNYALRLERFMPDIGEASKTTCVEIKPSIPYFNVKKYANIPLRLKIVRNADYVIFSKASLAGSHTATITLSDIYMTINTVRMDSTVESQMNQDLAKDYMIQYPTYKCERYTVNQQHFNQQLTTLSSKPKHIFIALQKQSRVSGDGYLAGEHAKLSSSVYDHANLTEIQITLNKTLRIPNIQRTQNFATGEYAFQVEQLLKLTGTAIDDYSSSSIISFKNFKDLYPIYAFNCRGSQYDDIPELNAQTCPVDVKMEFSVDPAADPLFMYIVYVFDTVLAVSNGVCRQVYGKST